MRPMIRSFIAALVVFVMAAAHAGELPFSRPAFDKALADGKPVVVDFWASWCPTCKEQKPIVRALMNDPKRKNLTLFLADFDKEEALKKQLGVTMQSTLVVLKGGKEVARSTGQTDPAELAGLLDKAF